MNENGFTDFLRHTALLVLVTLTGLPLLAHAQPLLETGTDAQITEDGLHRVAVSIMDAAWVLPNLNLARYDSLYLRPTGVSFRAVTGAGNRAGRRIEQTEFPIADQHKLAMRTDFEQAFREEFSAIAANPVSAVPGRRVLMAQGFLVDVVSSLPPDEPGTEYIQNLNWEATIVLELRDSMSDDIVARTVERERIQEIVDSDFVREQIRQLTSRWARLLHTRFDELSAIAR
jgi:hypothetical protein